MKNKYQILKMSLLLTIIVFFNSCSNENSIQQENKYAQFDFGQVDIGGLHNQYMIKSYCKIKDQFKSNENLMRSMPQKMLQQRCAEIIIDEYSSIPYDPTPIGYNHDQFMTKTIQMVDSLSSFQYDIRNFSDTYLNANLTELASQYIERMLNEIEADVSLMEIYQSLDNIEADANKNLINNDLTIVKGTIAIARSSAYLWAPVSEGGYDLLTKTFGTSLPENIILKSSKVVRQRTWWKQAIMGDISASSAYFLGIGIGGCFSTALVPVSATALLGGWAITAGLGSAFGALGI